MSREEIIPVHQDHFARRYNLLSHRLGLANQTKSEKFENTFKLFKTLDTFQSISNNLKTLNTAEAQLKSQQLFKAPPQNTESPSPLFVTQKTMPLKMPDVVKYRQRIPLNEQIAGQLKNMNGYLTEKFQKVNLAQNRQVADFKMLTEQKQEIKIPIQKPVEISENVITYAPKEINLEKYFKEYQEEAEKLRIKLKKRQMDFFNQKWGNSVVKMKKKIYDFKHKAEVKQRVSVIKRPTKLSVIQLRHPEIQMKEMREVVEDICQEEFDMFNEKQTINDEIELFQESMDQFFNRFKPKALIGIRMK